MVRRWALLTRAGAAALIWIALAASPSLGLACGACDEDSFAVAATALALGPQSRFKILTVVSSSAS